MTGEKLSSAIWHMPGRIAVAMLRAAAPSFWAQVGASMAMTLVFVGIGLAIWLGPWPEDRAEQQLTLLGWGFLASAFLVLVALVCILGLKVAVKASREGLDANLERDDGDPPATPTREA